MKFSFLMITYNQERYIKEALESVLAQDIDELEIIVCDDCSKDRTFEIASEIAQKYTGPFHIILHRNERNLGIGANFQKAYELSSGEWLFMAAGDDVSLPGRCRVVAENIPFFPKALAFACYMSLIDENGRDYGVIPDRNGLAAGAGICWKREIFSVFPPMGTVPLEDMTLFTRVFYLNGMYVRLPRVALKYRVDGHSYIGEERDTALGVRKFSLKKYMNVGICIDNRLECLEYLVSRGYSVPNYERNIERQQSLKVFVKKEIERLSEEISVLNMPLYKKIVYCIMGGVHKKGLLERIMLAASVVKFLIALKRLFIPVQTSVSVMARSTLHALPENAEPFVADGDYYLNNIAFDYIRGE